MHHVISETETFGRRLVARLETCNHAFVATAFLTRSGLDVFKDVLKDAVERRAKITFLLGQFDYITEPKAVATLLGLSKLPGARLRVFFDHEFEFHYKVALFRDEGHPVVILGSSNITDKGLSSRGEDNVEIVDETSLSNRLRLDLEARVSIALEAEEHLPKYEQLYEHYRQLRVARQRANRAGNRKLSGGTRRARSIPPLDLSTLKRLTYCNVSGYEEDAKIKKSIRRIVDRAAKSGPSFPNQWISLPRGSRRFYAKDESFLIADDTQRVIGVARCTHIDEVLDTASKKIDIVFHRYERGRKFKCRDEETYERKRALLRAGNKERLGPAAVQRVVKVLSGLARLRRP